MSLRAAPSLLRVTTAATRSTVRACAESEAWEHGGVLSRSLLADLGADRDVVRHAVASGRWRLHGDRTVAVHGGPLTVQADWWRAIWETGLRIAALDGASALAVAGLTGFTTPAVQVSIPHGSDPGRIPGVELHRIMRRLPGEVLTNGVPRVRPELAAIRAAHWAVSNRQATLVLAMSVQQRIVGPARLRAAVQLVRGRTRRAFIRTVVGDITDGAHSLGELDVRGMFRRRGLPAPTHQEVRRGPRGRVYLDVGWGDIGLGVEVDGAGHRWGLAVTEDNLRLNALLLGGRTVLRLDLLGLRLHEDAFLDQVCEAHARLSARSVPRAGQ